MKRFTNDGVYVDSLPGLPPGGRAEAIDVDNQGNIFLGTLNYTVIKYDSNWDSLAGWSEQGSDNGQFSGIQGIVVDYTGYVYVSDGGGDTCEGMNRRIQVFNCCQNRGNADGLETIPGFPIDVADLTYLVEYLFGGGAQPPCIEEANVDGTIGVGGPIDVADLTYLVAYLFVGGNSPPACP